jgi:hypothetical protein
MPLQLYAQCVALTHVARRAWEHGMLYFCQRMPGELARFRWVIDAKGKSITPQEDWWKVCVKPWLQSQTMRRPVAHAASHIAAMGRITMTIRDTLPSTPRMVNMIKLLWDICRGHEAEPGGAAAES